MVRGGGRVGKKTRYRGGNSATWRRRGKETAPGKRGRCEAGTELKEINAWEAGIARRGRVFGVAGMVRRRRYRVRRENGAKVNTRYGKQDIGTG